MNQIEPKLKEAMEYVEKAQHIMTELGHTKYAICDMVSKQMLLDLEREVSELLWKLENAKKECDARFTVEEIAQYISGWAMGPFDSVREIGKATLLNALSQLRCDQDGIEAVIRRKNK
jgi:hypothetical protein